MAVFQLMNEMSAISANIFLANLDYLFYICGLYTLDIFAHNFAIKI